MSHYDADGITVHHGDCLDVLPTLADSSVDAVCTDPPYGLEFMGKTWDSFKAVPSGGAGIKRTGYTDAERLPRPSFTGSPNPPCRNCGGTQRGADGQGVKRCRCDAPEFPNVRRAQSAAFQAWCQLWAAECLRVLKPGGFMLAAGGTRTFHRLVAAVEDAGFEIRDTITHLHGQGFPKSTRVSRDERFCHCDASVHTSSRTSPALSTGDRIRTGEPLAATVDAARSVRRVTSALPDSPGDCRPERDSGDESPHPVEEHGPASPPPPGCAPARNHSAGRGDGRDAEPSRTPSPARRNAHPSSLGSAHLASSQTATAAHIPASTSPADISESAPGIRDTAQDPSHSYYTTAFPLCTTCGKPQADGLGTALKPAAEFWTLARKPLSGSVAQTVLVWGTGALNVDGCRIGTADGDYDHPGNNNRHHGRAIYGQFDSEGRQAPPHAAGRWPANVILSHSATCTDTACVDGCPVRELDAQSGELTSRNRKAGRYGLMGYMRDATADMPAIDGDSGGASRFYFSAKADANERVRVPKAGDAGVGHVAHPT